MNQSNIKNTVTTVNYLSATGPVAVGMTNDYMFRIVFQENKYALKGLIASVLQLDPENITDIDISNEVNPGQSITDKEYRMDILVLMNNSQNINLEMQLRNQGNWQHRSLAYLCREFDSLDHGDDYYSKKEGFRIMFQKSLLTFSSFISCEQLRCL